MKIWFSKLTSFRNFFLEDFIPNSTAYVRSFENKQGFQNARNIL